MFRYFIRADGDICNRFFNHGSILCKCRVGFAPPLLLISMIGINTRTKKAEQKKPGLYEHWHDNCTFQEIDY